MVQSSRIKSQILISTDTERNKTYHSDSIGFDYFGWWLGCRLVWCHLRWYTLGLLLWVATIRMEWWASHVLDALSNRLRVVHLLNSFKIVVLRGSLVWLVLQLLLLRLWMLLMGACILSQTLTHNSGERRAGSILQLGRLEPAGVSLYGYILVGRKFLSLLGDSHLHQSCEWFGANLCLLGSWHTIFIVSLIWILVLTLVEVGAIVFMGLALGGQRPILRWLGDLE